MSLAQIKVFGDFSIVLPSHQPRHCSFPVGPNCSDYNNISTSHPRTVSVVSLRLSTADSEVTTLLLFSQNYSACVKLGFHPLSIQQCFAPLLLK